MSEEPIAPTPQPLLTAHDDGKAIAPPAPTTLLGAFDELLKRPHHLALRGWGSGSAHSTLLLLLGSVAGVALYGAAAGLFQGGAQVLISAFKGPLIVLLSLTLCLPSLYIFAALAGADLPGRLFLQLVAGFTGMLTLLLVGLLPISWLFSVSSRSLPFVVWLHVLAWAIAVAFGVRFLARTLREREVRGALFLWLLLFLFVSFQVSTYLRPVLWRAKGAPVFERQKKFFLEHLDDVYGAAREAKKPG